MAAVTLPPQGYLRQCLDYNPETGTTVWRERPLSHFKNESYQKRFNHRFAGETVGYRRSKATAHIEMAITYGGVCQNYLLHRVIWKLVYGRDPVEIDHINVDGSDNRLANLRECTHSQNMSNTKLRANNKSGFKGVFLLPHGKWKASIDHQNKTFNLGHFDTAEQAAAAYNKAASELHGDFAHLG